MEENKLTPNQILRRLSFGVKFKLSDKGIFNLDSEFGTPYEATKDLHVTNILFIEKERIEIEVSSDCGWGVGFVEIDEIKPILRKLSSLTTDDFVKMSNRIECFFEYDSVDNVFHLENDVLYSIDDIPVSSYLYLIENNYWLDEPEGSFVYAEDLEINPYN